MTEAEAASTIPILESGELPADGSSGNRFAAILWISCLAVSVGVHASVLLPLIGDDAVSVGDAGRIDAIAVEIVQLPVIASTQTVSDAAVEPAEKKVPQPPEPVDKTRIEEAEDALKVPSVAEKPVQDEQEKTDQPVEKANETKPLLQETQAIAVSASGASAGEIERYGREVARALAKSRPKGRGYRGSLRLAFVLDPEGKLMRVEVKDSSGNAALDRAALDAVRLVAFPPPPQGMSELQRSYVVPFRFN